MGRFVERMKDETGDEAKPWRGAVVALARESFAGRGVAAIQLEIIATWTMPGPSPHTGTAVFAAVTRLGPLHSVCRPGERRRLTAPDAHRLIHAR